MKLMKLYVKSFYTIMDTCHDHLDKGCGGGGGGVGLVS